MPPLPSMIKCYYCEHQCQIDLLCKYLVERKSHFNLFSQVDITTTTVYLLTVYCIYKVHINVNKTFEFQ